MPFGTAGDVHAQAGDANWLATLPPWLQKQVRQVQYNTGGDGGQMASRWVAGDSGGFGTGDQDSGGFIRDEKGNQVYQLGDWDGTGVGHGGFTVTDPKQIRHDPVLGDVVDPQYIKSVKKLGPNYAMLAAVLGAGALGTFAGLGAEAAGGAAAGTGAAEGAAGAAAGGSGLTPLTGVTLAPEASFLPMGEIGGGAAAAGGGGGLAELGGAGAAGGGGGAAGGAAGGGMAPVTDLSVQAAGGAGSSAGGAGSGLLSAVGGPSGAARLAGGLAALGGSHGSSSGTASGASTDPNSIIEQMAQANRVNQNTPLGSRNWVHNQDGTWTVNDTMNPAEQDNFQNVQGLNAGMTDYSRQALARMLSQPAPQRADRPLVVGGHTIGG